MPELPWSAGGCKALAQRLGLIPNRRKGQSFLPDRAVNERIVEAAGIEDGTPVLEIGPGLGHLTTVLTDAGAQVTAIELDPVLASHLGATFPTLKLATEDALASKDTLGPAASAWLESLSTASPGVVVSNLPYSIASPLLVLLLWADAPLDRLVVCVQKEVAARLAAGPESNAYGALSVLVGYRAKAEVLFGVGRSRFWPRPAVESQILRLTRREHVPRAVDEGLFRSLVRAAFHHRRKTLVNSVGRSSFRPALEALAGPVDAARLESALAATSLPAGVRAEKVDVAGLVRVANQLESAQKTP